LKLFADLKCLKSAKPTKDLSVNQQKKPSVIEAQSSTLPTNMPRMQALKPTTV